MKIRLWANVNIAYIVFARPKITGGTHARSIPAPLHQKRPF